jgi:predicted esterase
MPAIGRHGQEEAGVMEDGAARGAKLLAKPLEAWQICTGGRCDGPVTETGGIHRLNLDSGSKDSLLYVPKGYKKGDAVPLVLLLHGAGSDARNGLLPLLPLADERGLLLVAPSCRGRTWDAVGDSSGRDVKFIDRTLEAVFAEHVVDRSHFACAGFSDGASYALSLGIANGFLFSHIIAFSPGFMVPPRFEDAPEIFISHGTKDTVLSIDHCSRRIAPRLLQQGYSLNYCEFQGGHAVPLEVANKAMDWFLAPGRARRAVEAGVVVDEKRAVKPREAARLEEGRNGSAAEGPGAAASSA